ncbi:hypothetical protein [Pseudoalteromonas luteoviolacea]|uniref:t-SNARE coiled-coil homology domain-containing protein n=1 Tax=Pseudoalteromonas luteoviolacea S4054 TaxID=1129367 RepID=A0A0F6AA13_9GAMM|nr:hypothetical protein [Pseudoalteromonas luteoviolacea]AOT11143.1 hypothetical protein S4054249_25265 [Pseudoalteromonas luteoviolacea]AOT15693.1 hypothetical protein S40542_23245 [Pseudoalteromonas luteoviolacea]AOT20964.1 hypothetical protein S4054_25185 [Pseudoalteromonas luteoviolacea]KKE82249.1 hypothetical protein N479_19315 [Pseudoalteromonas luteoviolacea S4054]KZN65418.1 hypothetical protein N481_25015 [Pseudoalteromonas luteoviolacea S4047-1]
MKHILMVGAALSTMSLSANEGNSVAVPHEFFANTPAKAAEVNENFSFLSGHISENQTKLAELNTSLTSVVSGLNSQLTNANDKIENNTTSISTLQQAVSGNENALNNFIGSSLVSIQSLQTDKQLKTTQITQINTSLGSIRAEMADQAQTITALNTASTQNGAALEVMNTSLQVQTQAVSLANTRIQANESSLSALQQKVTQQEAVDTNIENRVTQLNTGISSVNTQLTAISTRSQANESSLNALQERVAQQEAVDTNIENRVTQLSNGVSSVNTQLSAISTRSQNNENSITTLSSSQTTLNTDLTNLDAAVSNLSATVNTQSSTISTIQSSVQGHGGRLDALEAARQPIQTYDPIINPHEDILDAPINYSYIATAPGDVFSLHGENFRMYRFPVMDFETNQRYAVDIPLSEGNTYESIGVSTMCSTFHLSPSQPIGDNAKAIFSVSGFMQRQYKMGSDKIESSYSLQRLRPQIQVKIGRYTCFSLTLGKWSGGMEVDGQGALASGQYDLTNGFNWPAKADRIDEVVDFSRLANYIRVTAL